MEIKYNRQAYLRGAFGLSRLQIPCSGAAPFSFGCPWVLIQAHWCTLNRAKTFLLLKMEFNGLDCSFCFSNPCILSYLQSHHFRTSTCPWCKIFLVSLPFFALLYGTARAGFYCLFQNPSGKLVWRIPDVQSASGFTCLVRSAGMPSHSERTELMALASLATCQQIPQQICQCCFLDSSPSKCIGHRIL